MSCVLTRQSARCLHQRWLRIRVPNKSAVQRLFAESINHVKSLFRHPDRRTDRDDEKPSPNNRSWFTRSRWIGILSNRLLNRQRGFLHGDRGRLNNRFGATGFAEMVDVEGTDPQRQQTLEHHGILYANVLRHDARQQTADRLHPGIGHDKEADDPPARSRMRSAAATSQSLA